MSENGKSVLVLFAHPSLEHSQANRHLLDVSLALEGVTTVDLYAEYPSGDIDIDREQQRLRDHDVVVFMFPLFWYSTPALLKEWQDLVLEYGFAYGTGGTALHGKQFLCAITAGGRESAYREQGYNHYSIRQLLRPLEQTATLCGMQYLPPYALFGSRTAVEEGRLQSHLDGWREVVANLRSGALDSEQVMNRDQLNEAPFGIGEGDA